MKSPITIVELRHPRCSLRFGTAPCPATGTPQCYNTWATCPTPATRAVYADTGTIWWRFVANRPGLFAFGDFSSADAPKTNGIPVNGLQVSTSKAQINVGGMLDGKSPFGVRATCSVTMEDFAWSDPVGDFYLTSRSGLPQRTFWTTFLARVKLFSNITMVIYDGYEGDTLAAMRQRLYVLDGIDGPKGGKVTLRGIDPLMLVNRKRAEFPPAMTMSLMQDLAVDATSLRVSTDDEANLSDTMGLTTGRHLMIGSEIIGYSGYTVIGAGAYDVTGLVRGLGGTTPAAAKTGDAVGRAGHFDAALLPDIGKYLLQNWTTIPDAWIDLTGWDAERDDWLGLFRGTAFITKPTPVEDLFGELAEQGPFFVWWDEYAQQIKLRAVRPPSTTVPLLTDATAILADSAELVRLPESRLTRIFIFYSLKVATDVSEEGCTHLYGTVNGDGELAQAGGAPRLVSIVGRFVENDNHAFSIINRIQQFYAEIPRQLTFDISAKDRTIGVADMVDVTSRVSVDTEGRSITERWLVTSWEELQPGTTYRLEALAYPDLGRLAWMMATTAHDYATATQIEKDGGAFMCGTNGLMADGSEGYVMQ